MRARISVIEPRGWGHCQHPPRQTPGDPWLPAVFTGVKWQGRGVDNPSSSSAEVKERVELYLQSPAGPSGLHDLFWGELTLLLLNYYYYYYY